MKCTFCEKREAVATYRKGDFLCNVCMNQAQQMETPRLNARKFIIPKGKRIYD